MALARLGQGFFTPMKTITLSDNLPCDVRTLQLYELDAIPFNDPGPFLMVDVLAGGETQTREYDLSAWDEPPKKPNVPKEDCEPDSMEAALWLIYDRYQAAVYQHTVRLRAFIERGHSIARYILANCIAEADRKRVVTPEDYHKIYTVAMVREVKMEDIEAVLASTFPGLVEWCAAYARFIRRQEIQNERNGRADVGGASAGSYAPQPARVGINTG